MSTQHPDYITVQSVYVALDIGKNVHAYAAYTGVEASLALKPVIPPQAVLANRAGFEQVAHALTALLTGGRFARVVLGHEPTGIYHEAWSRAFLERFAPYLRTTTAPYLDYRFVNPYQTKLERQKHLGRNRKTDALDLPAIARCLADGEGTPAYLPGPDELPLTLWATTLRQTLQAQRLWSVRLQAELDQLWPGAYVNVKRFRQAHPDLEPPVPLVLSKPFARALIQALVTHCPNPHALAAMTPAQVIAFLRAHLGRGGPQTAARLLDCVRTALLPPPDIAALLAPRLQDDFASYQALAARRAQLEEQAAQLVPTSPAAVLVSVPGISALLAARYLAGLGHHQRFTTPSQIWALAGFDPLPDDSGDRRRAGHLSKKGDALLRDTLFMIGLHTSQHCPQIRRVRERALARGLGKIGAIVHAAHKANRLCWHLLYHQEPYNPAYER